MSRPRHRGPIRDSAPTTDNVLTAAELQRGYQAFTDRSADGAWRHAETTDTWRHIARYALAIGMPSPEIAAWLTRCGVLTEGEVSSIMTNISKTPAELEALVKAGVTKARITSHIPPGTVPGQQLARKNAPKPEGSA